MDLNVQTLTMIGWLIPLAVGVITKKWASGAVKAISNLALSAITGGIAVAVQADGHVTLTTWLVNIAVTFIQSIVAYYGLWKPSGVAPAVQNVAPGVGIGSGWKDDSVGQTSDSATKINGLTYEEVRAMRPVPPRADTLAKADPPTAKGDDVVRDLDEEPDLGHVQDRTPDAHYPEKPLDIADEMAQRARAARSRAAKKAAETRRANKAAAAKKAPTKKAAAAKRSSR